MSSTISTSRPSIAASRSLRIRTTPEDLVADPYEATAMKSTSTGIVEVAHQVREEEHGALEHADEQQVLARVVARDLARPAPGPGAARSSAGTRVSPIASSSRPRVSTLRGVRRARAGPAVRASHEAQHPRSVDAPARRRQIEHRGAVLGQRGDLVGAPARPRRAGPPAAPSASRWTTSRRSAGGSARSRASSISLAPVERLVDERVEHGAPRRAGSRRAPARSPRRRDAPPRAPAPARSRIRPRAYVVDRCSRPRASSSPRSPQ